MYYYYYYNYFQKDIMVYLDEINRGEKTIIFDFLTINEFIKFNNALNINVSVNDEGPYMVKMKYESLDRQIRPNTVYTIDRETIANLQARVSRLENSFLFRYSIEIDETFSSFFKDSVTIDEDARYELKQSHSGKYDLKKISKKFTGALSVIIRNVGQGNWNEIMLDDKVIMLYDAGAPTNASILDVRNIIGNRPSKYVNDRPGLFLSHWDKDHYHGLLGMTDSELSYFSYFVCVKNTPTATSTALYKRIESILGAKNIATFTNKPKIKRGPPNFHLLFSNNQLLVFIADYHKNINLSGIILALQTKSSSIVLPGDCQYIQISNDILPYLNQKQHHLVVPHHGGEAGPYVYNTAATVNRDTAVFSVGNQHGHPFPRNESAITNDFSNVRNTNLISNDIVINL